MGAATTTAASQVAGYLQNLFFRGTRSVFAAETLFPRTYDDIQEVSQRTNDETFLFLANREKGRDLVFVLQILRQARDNCTAIRVSGGTFPSSRPLPDDVIVDMRYIDRLIGLDVYQQT